MIASEHSSHQGPIPLASTPQIFLDADLGETPCTGTVTEILKDRLCADFHGETTPSMPQRLEGVALHVDGLLFGRVVLQIDETWEEKGTRHIIASPGDEKSAAIFWEIFHRLQAGLSFRECQQIQVKKEEIPRIPGRGRYTEEARLERLAFVREQTQATLNHVETNSFKPEKLAGNIESFIGSVEIPVGVAGPLLIQGQHAKGLYYAPLATSEGALVASISRGAMALTRSGGVSAHVLGQRMMRAPLFVLSNMKAAHLFAAWITDHFHEIREYTRKFSNYADLKELIPSLAGRTVNISFIYESGDAAGQNMTTTCTWNTCQWILKQLKHFRSIHVENFLIDGNTSSDKKVTLQSFISGRGIRVHAEAFLSKEVLESVLKITPEQMYSVWISGATGGVLSGMVGSNVNIANAIAAIFTATGQDIASVHEASIGQFVIEPSGDGVYTRLLLPSLTVGTVGGGTGLRQQRECLEMLGCAGPGKAQKFAEIIAAFTLSLEISTAAAMGSGQFASAHERLGRNREVNHLKRGELDTEFFTTALARQNPGDAYPITQVEALPATATMDSSILSQHTARKSHRMIGHFPYRITHAKGETTDLVLKIKPTDREVIHMMNTVGSLSDARLFSEMKKANGRTGFSACHTKELAISDIRDPRFTKYIPKTHGIVLDENREIFIIIQEHLKGMELMDSADEVSGWTQDHLFAAIDGIAEIHSIWYDDVASLKEEPWMKDWATQASMIEFSMLWKLLGLHAFQEFPEWFGQKDLDLCESMVNDIPNWWGIMETMPKTLIHNDFNPRNVAFRPGPDGPLLCAYDWELATIHLPQHDTAELLAFVLDESATWEELDRYITRHRHRLEAHTHKKIDAGLWREGFHYCLQDFMINRLASYIMIHTVRDYSFIERVYRTTRHLLGLCNQNPQMEPASGTTTQSA